MPDPVYKLPFSLHRFPGTEKPMPEADMKDKVKHGFYLAMIGHCMECHTPMTRGQWELDKIGKGGREFPGPWGTSVSRNVTSSKTSGIGDWTDAEIKTAITQGKRKDGTPLKPPMGYRLLRQDDGQRPKRRDRLAADAAAEGLGPSGLTCRRGSGALQLRGAGPISWLRRAGSRPC